MKHLLSRGVIAVAMFAATAQFAAAAEKLPDAVRVTNSSCVCYLPANLAAKRGWLKEEYAKIGVKLEIQQYEDGPSQNAALLSGALDIGQYGSTSTATLISRNAPIKVFYLSDREISTEGLVARKDAGIAGIADLKGKTVGVTVGSSSEYGLRASLREAGLGAGDVKILNVAPPAVKAAWQRGDIQASYTWDPFLSQLVADGGVSIETIGQLSEKTNGKYNIFGLYIARSEIAEKHPELLKAYVRAIDHAVTYIRDHKEEVAAEFREEYGATTTADALSQINGERYFALSDPETAAYLGTRAQPGKLVDLIEDTWAFYNEVGTVTKAPSRPAIAAAINPAIPAAQ